MIKKATDVKILLKHSVPQVKTHFRYCTKKKNATTFVAVY